MVRIGVIGGSGMVWEEEAGGSERVSVSTPYGNVEVMLVTLGGKQVALLPRHGFARCVPPHLINYRANIWGLKELGIEDVITTAAVGSLAPRLTPGSLALVTDFLDFTRSRPFTFCDQPGELVHTDFSEPYSRSLNKALAESASALSIPIDPSAVYLCAEGPRYETPAEIRMFAKLGGEVVGMTGVPEVVLAHEKGLRYATIAIITNWAAGIAVQPLSHEEVLSVMSARAADVRALIRRTIEGVPASPSDKPHGYKAGKPSEEG